MREIILCKFGEIALKGLNKSNFESVLVKNVRRRLKRLGEFELRRAQSTLYVSPLDSSIDMDEVDKLMNPLAGPEVSTA
jgi:thiamine biosynthesis protein ThiI